MSVISAFLALLCRAQLFKNKSLRGIEPSTYQLNRQMPRKLDVCCCSLPMRTLMVCMISLDSQIWGYINLSGLLYDM